MQHLLGPQTPVAEASGGPGGWVRQLEVAAACNQSTVDALDAESGDLHLNGAPIPNAYLPKGFVYPMTWGTPDDCFIEGVGPDGA